jgi:adenylate cyclase
VSQTRRLAAILAADVAGYSRLIEADEEGTLGRLRVLRAETIDPRIAGHRGRIVKTTGDGLLVEFASVVDALRCAAELQADLAEGNAALSPDRVPDRQRPVLRNIMPARSRNLASISATCKMR